METIELKNNKVLVIRKNIKHMYLKIKRASGEVQLMAPREISLEIIEKFVKEKEPWIRTHTIYSEDIKRIITQDIKEGVEILFFGKYLKIEYRYITKNPLYFKVTNDTLILYIKMDTEKDKINKLVERFYREELGKKIDENLDKWLKNMNLTINGARIKKMKTRWGTCNTRKKNIWINFELVKIDEKYLEYVVIHELVHMFETGHGEKFKKKMAEFYPKYKEVEEQLDKYIIS